MNSINPKIPVVSPRSAKQIEAVTLEILKELSPESLRKPSAVPALGLFDYLIPEKYGFKSGIQSMAKGLEGWTDVNAKTVFLASDVYDFLELDDGRARFSAMHESGHVVLHGTELNLNVSTSGGQTILARRGDVPAYQNPEWQANHFASAILMPQTMVLQVFESTRGNREAQIKAIMAIFKVSWTAAEIRLNKLGLLESAKGGTWLK